MLEASLYSDNCYATLSYDNKHLPLTSTGLGTLVPEHVRDWLKRLRKNFPPKSVRFYLCGEYGDETFRPHYHAALFNVPTCLRGRTRRRVGSTRPIWEGCCSACELVGNTWGFGDVDLGILERHSAQYVAGYVTKKMTRGDDPRLLGRWPEFSRQSNRSGGLGLGAMHEVASQLLRYDLEKTQADVPSSLRHGGRELPLGRYLQGKLRTMVGKDEKAPLATIEKLKADLQPLRDAAFNASVSFKSKIIEAGATGRIRLAQKQRLYKRNKTL